MSHIYLSICIPTNGRIEILKNTLDSIFINCTADYNDFEVILSDNSKDDELLELLNGYQHYPNIIYSKTSCEGFLNSVNALQLANGLFLKLHNNYTKFNNSSINQMISFVKNTQEIKPVVFFTNGLLEKHSTQQYDSFDLFTNELSYWNSWSTGFSIWKQDLDRSSLLGLSVFFPQTSLLLLQHDKKAFIIDNTILFTNQEVSKKGGYNLFKTFGVDYLELMENASKSDIISAKTFTKIKNDLFHKFFVEWYYNTKIAKNEFTFDLSGIKESLMQYYSVSKYYELLFRSYLLGFKIKVSSLVKTI